MSIDKRAKFPTHLVGSICCAEVPLDVPLFEIPPRDNAIVSLCLDMSSTNTKRVRGGVGSIDSDSDEEIEVDTSACLAHNGISVDYREHVSKRRKPDLPKSKSPRVLDPTGSEKSEKKKQV